MKKSFKEILDDTFRDTSKWNYYGDEGIIIDNPFNSIEDSKQFIKKFISLSEKANTNELFKKIDGLGDRAIHIVSTFFLGIYLYENPNNKMQKEIDNQLLKLIEKYEIKSNINFSFIWFLACLFHDLGYEYEEKVNHLPRYTSYEDFIQNFNPLKKADGVPPFYSALCKPYFNFKTNKRKENDHGICASFVLFRDLCNIRREQENSDKKTSTLSWEPALENIYNFASWIILAHNIWYVRGSNEYDSKCYKDAGLSALILKEKEYKISSSKYPFLFLFCLIDSIEPLKRIKDVSLLDKIKLTIEKDKIIIESELTCSCHDLILKQASDVNKWLTTATKKDNSVLIDIFHANGAKV